MLEKNKYKLARFFCSLFPWSEAKFITPSAFESNSKNKTDNNKYFLTLSITILGFAVSGIKILDISPGSLFIITFCLFILSIVFGSIAIHLMSKYFIFRESFSIGVKRIGGKISTSDLSDEEKELMNIEEDSRIIIQWYFLFDNFQLVMFIFGIIFLSISSFIL